MTSPRVGLLLIDVFASKLGSVTQGEHCTRRKRKSQMGASTCRPVIQACRSGLSTSALVSLIVVLSFQPHGQFDTSLTADQQVDRMPRAFKVLCTCPGAKGLAVTLICSYKSTHDRLRRW